MAYNESLAVKISSFRQLRAWQKAREIAVTIYKATELFPKNELHGLSSQIQKSAVSVVANIAEGFSRNTHNDKSHFYATALGSLTESMNHAYIASDLNFINSKELSIIEAKADVLHKMINGMIKKAPERISRTT